VTLDSADGTMLLSAWDGAERVYVVDAVTADLPPGTIVRLTAEQLMRSEGVRTLSTHGIGVREAVEISHVLGMLPDRLAIYGIAGQTFAPGDGITSLVESAGRRVIARLRRSVRRRVPRHA
jgi:hydrogenase maturation protease